MKHVVRVVVCIVISVLLGLVVKMSNTIDELGRHKTALENEVAYVKAQLLASDNMRLAGLIENRNLGIRTAALEKDKKSLLTRLTRTLNVTAYSASAEETDGDPEIAASMKPVRPGTVAVSRDLFNQGWGFGKKVHIEGMGTYVINDLMSSQMKKRVDVYVPEKDKAIRFGLKQKKITLLGD